MGNFAAVFPKVVGTLAIKLSFIALHISYKNIGFCETIRRTFKGYFGETNLIHLKEQFVESVPLNVIRLFTLSTNNYV